MFSNELIVIVMDVHISWTIVNLIDVCLIQIFLKHRKRMKFAQKKYLRRQRFASNKRLKLGSIVGALRKDLIFHNPFMYNLVYPLSKLKKIMPILHHQKVDNNIYFPSYA